MTQLIENKPPRRGMIATLSHFCPPRRRFVGRSFSSDIRRKSANYSLRKTALYRRSLVHSNREIRRLEPLLSNSKQTIGTHSNSEFSHGLFSAFSPVNSAMLLPAATLPTAMSTRFCEVALPVPLRSTFTYAVPASLNGEELAGRRVVVPFRNRAMVGLSLGETERAPEI